MVATKQVPLVSTIDYAPSATRSISLERVGVITDLVLRVRVQYDTAAGATALEDALARIIKGIAIRDGQGHSWWACGDGRQLHWLNYMQYQGQVRMDAVTTAVGTDKVAEALWRIHFGVNPLNAFDPSAGIPADELAQLSLEVTWGTAADFGTNQTIDSGTVYVTPSVILADGSPGYAAVKAGMLRPSVRWEKYDISAVVGELGIRRELPVATMLHKTALLIVDASDNRSNDEVGEVGFYRALENTTPWRMDWTSLTGYTQARYGLPALPTGIAMVQWGQIAGNAALDLRGRSTGYDYLAFSSLTSTGDIWLLHLAYTK